MNKNLIAIAVIVILIVFLFLYLNTLPNELLYQIAPDLLVIGVGAVGIYYYFSTRKKK